MEPAKALASYGLDSLGAVEIRGWMRMGLGAELMTLGVANAKSLAALCERVAELISVGGDCWFRGGGAGCAEGVPHC